MLQPMRCRHDIIGEAHTVPPPDDVLCHIYAENIIFQVDAFRVWKALKIFTGSVIRAIIDKDQFDLPIGKIRVCKDALDRFLGIFQLVIAKQNDAHIARGAPLYRPMQGFRCRHLLF